MLKIQLICIYLNFKFLISENRFYSLIISPFPYFGIDCAILMRYTFLFRIYYYSFHFGNFYRTNFKTEICLDIVLCRPEKRA